MVARSGWRSERSERTKVLRMLDDHNINAYSLFDSAEALLETLALRRLLFGRSGGRLNPD